MLLTIDFVGSTHNRGFRQVNNTRWTVLVNEGLERG